MEHYDAVVVGGGGTGAATAYDLALRGCSVLLLEKGEFSSGTTGRHHGQLHSGARYALADPAIAHECMAETRILRRIVPSCIEYNQGLFLALNEEEAKLCDEFVHACREADIPASEISVQRALELEKQINAKALKAVLVPDGSMDAYRLLMSFMASASARGAVLKNFTECLDIETKTGAVSAVYVRDLASERDYRVECSAVVNAAGPWAEQVAAKAGASVPLTAAAGAMVAVQGRLTNMVVSRLRHASDGDIIVPQRKLSIIGSTQRKVDGLDALRALPEEVGFLLEAADELVPGFSRQKVFASWAAARPLAGRSSDDGRSISRDVVLHDHGKTDQVPGFFSIIGGKATTLRLMGEMAADAVAAYLGIDEPSRTALFELHPYEHFWKLP